MGRKRQAKILGQTEHTETRWTQNAHTNTHTQTCQVKYFYAFINQTGGGTVTKTRL